MVVLVFQITTLGDFLAALNSRIRILEFVSMFPSVHGAPSLESIASLLLHGDVNVRMAAARLLRRIDLTEVGFCEGMNLIDTFFGRNCLFKSLVC